MGSKKYVVTAVYWDTYGIEALNPGVITNSTSIIWDRIIVKTQSETTLLGSIRVWFILAFEYDSSPVKDALLEVNGVKAKEIMDGVYEAILPTWSPIVGISVHIEKEGFKPIEIREVNYAIGNILLWIILLVLTIVLLAIVRERLRRR
ncbi:MAG TPA: hypothetical protein VNL13_00135 [Sulfolobales archaeon]|nr:hypothetical protein [Sulfolobales archaeon]